VAKSAGTMLRIRKPHEAGEPEDEEVETAPESVI
jgi:hypothetical protein